MRAAGKLARIYTEQPSLSPQVGAEGKGAIAVGRTPASALAGATSYQALGARARQFAEFMFSPQSVAEAMRGVYTSPLARDA